MWDYGFIVNIKQYKTKISQKQFLNIVKKLTLYIYNI